MVGAAIRGHDFDPLRFDVVVNDQMFYVRANSPQDRDGWLASLRETKVCEGRLGFVGRLEFMKGD